MVDEVLERRFGAAVRAATFGRFTAALSRLRHPGFIRCRDRVARPSFRGIGPAGSCLYWAVSWRRTQEVGPVVSDLRQLVNDIIRFEIELWNAVDARLKSECGLPRLISSPCP